MFALLSNSALGHQCQKKLSSRSQGERAEVQIQVFPLYPSPIPKAATNSQTSKEFPSEPRNPTHNLSGTGKISLDLKKIDYERNSEVISHQGK